MDHSRDLLVGAMERITTTIANSLAEKGKGETFLIDTTVDEETGLPYSTLHIRKPTGGVGIFTVKPTLSTTTDFPNNDFLSELIYQLKMWPRTDPNIPYYMLEHAKRLCKAIQATQDAMTENEDES